MLFLPFELSADTDWGAFESIVDPKCIEGFAFVLFLLIVSFYTSTKKLFKPISFGIMWFFIALSPTSSFIPLTEVMNDHRMYFPFVGLILSVGWAVYLTLRHILLDVKNIGMAKSAIVSFFILFILLYSYGTYQRNKVWHNEETLWKDVTEKSPNNGRGLMNYGISFLEKGEAQRALDYFSRAQELLPNYPKVYTNKAIALNLIGKDKEAIENFEKAISFNLDRSGSNFFYARFLYKNGNSERAVTLLKESIQLAPARMDSRHLLMEILYFSSSYEQLENLVRETLSLKPNDQESMKYVDIKKSSNIQIKDAEILSQSGVSSIQLLNLGLEAFNKGNYESCIILSKLAIDLNPKYAKAYNNVCASYLKLGQFQFAEKACLKALEIDPDFKMAKNNLVDVRNGLK